MVASASGHGSRLAVVLWMSTFVVGCFGCGGAKSLCSADADCTSGKYCDQDMKRCIPRLCSEQQDCGPQAICDVPNSSCIAEDTHCSPACQPFEDCIRGACQMRYEKVILTRPSPGGVGVNVPVEAALVVRPGWIRNDPLTLGLQIDGQDAGTLSKKADGVYGTVWHPPLEAAYTLLVSYSDAGLFSIPVTVQADLQVPAFTMEIPKPVRAGTVNGVSDVDPDLAEAWQRDQEITVTVASTATDVATDRVRLRVKGIGATGTADSSFEVKPVDSSICGGTPYCGRGRVDLAVPSLTAFRGTFGLSAVGEDKVGNVGQADGTVPVTRWKWSRANAFPVTATPAIGHAGTLYFGVHAGGSAQTFFALTPEGQVKWSKPLGTVEASPTVGKWNGADETVYVGAKDTNAALWAFQSDGGTVGGAPLYSGGGSADFIGSPVLVSGVLPEESVGVLVNLAGTSGTLVLANPHSMVTSRSDAGLGTIDFPGNVVTDEKRFYFGDHASKIQALELQGNALVPVWSLVTGGPTHVSALGLLSWYGAAAPGLFTVPLSGTNPTTASLLSSPSPVLNLALDADERIVYVDESARLRRLTSESNEERGNVTLASPSTAAPLLGEDGRVYVVSEAAQTLQAVAPSLQGAAEWSIALSGNIDASPTLDCSRDVSGTAIPGRPGRLYVGTSSGFLYSIVVDSRGIDTHARWPKYQHDPRNTGNSMTSLVEFACP